MFRYARHLMVSGCGVLLSLFALTGQAQTFSDPLTSSLSSKYWSIGTALPGVYSYSYSSNGMHLQKVGTVTQSVQAIGIFFNLGAINAANASNFDTKVSFTGATFGSAKLDQLLFNAAFTDGSFFYGAYQNGGANGSLTLSVWDGASHNTTPVSGNTGTLELLRHNGKIAFLFNGMTIWTKSGTSPLNTIVFVLQNGGTNDNIAVTYSNFSFTTNVTSTVITGVLKFDGLVAYAPSQNVTFVLRPTDGSANITQTVLVPPSGEFGLAGIPPKAYTLHIQDNKYLSANVSVNTTAGNVSGVTATLLAGDTNNDNSVDSTDFGVLIGAYGSDSTIPGSGYDATADFNGDGSVDSTDFGLLIGNFNTMGAP